MYCGRCGAGNPADARFCAGCGSVLSARGNGSKTALIIALGVGGGLVAIMTIGIIAAIAIPNFLNAVDRGKQKRTMADLRSIGTAVEEYSVDHDAYPVANDLDELSRLIAPRYIRAVPRTDGWGRPFLVHADGESYTLVSPGKDGLVSGCEGGATSTFASDVCFADGEFTQWPEGMQR